MWFIFYFSNICLSWLFFAIFPSHPSYPPMFCRLMPSEVADLGRWSCKFTQQHTSLTGERRAPKIAQTAIGERGPKWYFPRTEFWQQNEAFGTSCEHPSHTQTLLVVLVFICADSSFSLFKKTIILDGFSLRCPRYMPINSCGLRMREGFCVKINTETHTWKTLKALVMWVMCLNSSHQCAY